MNTRKTFLSFLVLLTSFQSYSQVKRLDIKHLTSDFSVYTTYNEFGGKLYPANSMYVVTKDGVVMIDTPWDDNQLEPLLDSIEKRHHKKVIMSISTHFHADRTSGLEILQDRGIKTFSSSYTQKLCLENDQQVAEYHFSRDTTFKVGQYFIKTYFPGHGHSPDNILVWFEKEKVLYGGCFVKSTESTDVGNVSDANVPEWEKSLMRAIQQFPAPKYVIPGHQSWADAKSMQHTLRIVKSYNSSK